MKFDKTLRLLNIATDAGNGYLRFYTELDNSFVPGDTLYINGGYYDNINALAYPGTNLSANNPFNNLLNFNGYKVLSINIVNNSFVLNIPIQSPNIIFPFGTIDNPKGDPTDSMHLAYNNYDTSDMYKSVFISKTNFIRGRFIKGTINNGSFGNDFTNVIINALDVNVTINNKYDITINHIATKNVNINAGQILSKTDALNPITTKIKLIEDTITSVLNIPVSPNNNGFGYSCFDIILSTNAPDNALYIDNGEFTNARHNGISLNGVIVNKIKLGNKNEINNSLSINPFIFNNATIYNIPISNTVLHNQNIVNGYIDNYISLTPDSYTPDVTQGVMILTVPYDIVANKLWITDINSGVGSGMNVSIIGCITNGNKNINTIDTGRIIDAGYIFNDRTSAYITILFDTLAGLSVGDFISFINSGPDFSNIKICDNVNGIFTGLVSSGNLTIESAIFNATLKEYIRLSNVDFKCGIINNIIFSNLNTTSTSWKTPISIDKSYQMYLSSSLNNFNYTIFGTIEKNNILRGNFNNCYINSGEFTNSIFNNCYIDTINILYPTFLYNSDIIGISTVTDNVYWDLIYFNPTEDVYVSGILTIPGGSFQGRKTSFSTDIGDIAPLTGTTKTRQFNAKEAQLVIASDYYSQIKSNNLTYTKELKFQLQKTYDISTNTNILYQIVDNGDLAFDGYLYIPGDNRKQLLFGDILDNNITLRTIINNVNTLNFTGINDVDFTTTSLHGVDKNYIYKNEYYNSDTINRNPENLLIKLHEIPDYIDIETATVPAYPLPGYYSMPNPIYPIDVQLKMYIDTIDFNSNTLFDIVIDEFNITPYNTITTTGNCILAFDHTPGKDAHGIDALYAPLCFIEIERVVVILQDSASVLPDYELFINCNYVPAIFSNTSSPYSNNIIDEQPNLFESNPNITYNNTTSRVFLIKDTLNIPIGITINSPGILGSKYTINVEYVITYYYNSHNNNITTFDGGYRERKVAKFVFGF